MGSVYVLAGRIRLSLVLLASALVWVVLATMLVVAWNAR
jgi:uncharacterized membrane protein (GlpM family)